MRHVFFCGEGSGEYEWGGGMGRDLCLAAYALNVAGCERVRCGMAYNCVRKYLMHNRCDDETRLVDHPFINPTLALHPNKNMKYNNKNIQ